MIRFLTEATQIADAPNAWQVFWESVGDFFANDTVQGIAAWADKFIYALILTIFFKYILPRLMENERNKKIINETDQKFQNFLEQLDTKLNSSFGINLGLKQDMLALKEAFRVAFQEVNIGPAAKLLIGTILQNMIEGKPIDISDELDELGEEAAAAVTSFTESAQQIFEENKQTAYNQLKETLSLLENEELPEDETEQEV